jgi:hypothetical protein
LPPVQVIVELQGPHETEQVRLEGDRLSVGQSSQNDIVIRNDPAVSRVHLLLEVVGPAWTVQDLGSRNGTFLNGERLLGTRVLRASDNLRLGSTRLQLTPIGVAGAAGGTEPAVPPPELTRRERDCLVALCEPVLLGSVTTEPATVTQMAEALVVSESAVKKLLSRLYDKFGLEGQDRRRGRLASDALRRGAVHIGAR